MKKLILIIFLSVACIAANASHIISGNIYYTYKNTTNNVDFYEVNIVLYRDCDASSVGFDSSIFIAVYSATTNTIVGNTIAVPLASDVASQPIVLPSGMATAVGCYRKGVYTTTIGLTPNAEGYYILWQRCCLRPGNNFIDDTGISCLAFVPGNLLKNNMCASPTQETSVILGVNQFAEMLLTNTDADGDSLSYHLANPYSGASASNPIVNTYSSTMLTPLPTVSYRNGFSAQQPFGTGGIFSLDNNTGKITLNTPKTGLYILGIDVKEWRNGVEINSSRREFVVLVKTTGIANGIDLVANADGAKKINLAWNFTTIEIIRNQKLLRKTQGATTWDTIATPPLGTLNYTDSVGLQYDSVYQYLLKAETAKWPQFSAVKNVKLDSTSGITNVIQNSLSVYPNPATDKLFIKLPDNFNAQQITITDALGRLVMRLNPDDVAEPSTINIETLARGLYILSVINNRNILTTKFYKQ
jgi:hypothetical protein